MGAFQYIVQVIIRFRMTNGYDYSSEQLQYETIQPLINSLDQLHLKIDVERIVFGCHIHNGVRGYLIVKD